MDYVTEAKALGFTDAALMPVRELVIVPEYRVFCEENLCGNYNVLPACPPASGTVEEMTARVRQYETALVLMVEHTPKDYTDRQEQKAAKRHQNELTEQLINRMRENGTTDTLMMGAGPWKTASCMSAYCIFVRRLAEQCGMEYDCGPGLLAFFGMYVFD